MSLAFVFAIVIQIALDTSCLERGIQGDARGQIITESVLVQDVIHDICLEARGAKAPGTVSPGRAERAAAGPSNKSELPCTS